MHAVGRLDPVSSAVEVCCVEIAMLELGCFTILRRFCDDQPNIWTDTLDFLRLRAHNRDMSNALPAWKILGIHPTVNGQFKVIARRGSCVVHADRLTQEDADAFDPQAFWDSGVARPAPNSGASVLELI